MAQQMHSSILTNILHMLQIHVSHVNQHLPHAYALSKCLRQFNQHTNATNPQLHINSVPLQTVSHMLTNRTTAQPGVPAMQQLQLNPTMQRHTSTYALICFMISSTPCPTAAQHNMLKTTNKADTYCNAYSPVA
jgi:hypothetical protein